MTEHGKITYCIELSTFWCHCFTYRGYTIKIPSESGESIAPGEMTPDELLSMNYTFIPYVWSRLQSMAYGKLEAIL